MGNNKYDLPEYFCEKYYEYYKERIISACKQEYESLINSNTDFYIPTEEGTYIWLSPEAVGRIMAIMFFADDWKTVGTAWKLCQNDNLRKNMYQNINK